MTFDQNRLWSFAVLLSLVSPAAAQTIPAVDLQPFLRKDSYERIKISPTGDYYAATVPLADRRSDQTPTAKTEDREDTVIADFWRVSENRIMAGMAKKYGCNDTPLATGELFAVDVDGGRSRWLTGPTDYSYALMHDDLRNDDDNVQISVTPYGENPEPRWKNECLYRQAQPGLGRAGAQCPLYHRWRRQRPFRARQRFRQFQQTLLSRSQQ